MSTLTLDSECKYVIIKMCKKNSYFIFPFLCQVSIDEDLKDCREVSFQAALLYTSSKVIDGIIICNFTRFIPGREEDQSAHPLHPHHGQPPGGDPER